MTCIVDLFFRPLGYVEEAVMDSGSLNGVKLERRPVHFLSCVSGPIRTCYETGFDSTLLAENN